MKKTIDINLQQAFAINPEGVRLCPRGICRRARWRFCLKLRGKPPSSGAAPHIDPGLDEDPGKWLQI